MAAVVTSRPTRSPLDSAILKGDLSWVRALLSSKATPSEISFKCAGDNAQMLLALLNTTASHLKRALCH